MNHLLSYAALEALVLTVVGLASLIVVLTRFVPGAMARFGHWTRKLTLKGVPEPSPTAVALNRMGGSVPSSRATRACGDGCSSCGSCSTQPEVALRAQTSTENFAVARESTITWNR